MLGAASTGMHIVYLIGPCIYSLEAKCECKRNWVTVLPLYMDGLDSFMCHPTAGEQHGRSCLQTPADSVGASWKRQCHELRKGAGADRATHLPAAAVKKGMIEA